jgi:diguanylate cyclase (GGDEF)-like protein
VVERGLTGALGWRQFLDIAEGEVARARRHDNALSCLVIGVDKFGPGDVRQDRTVENLVLRQIVSICRMILRTSDTIGRIEASEFAVMLPEAGLLNALGVAERILAELAGASGEGSPCHLTAAISIGVAEYEDHTRPLSHLLDGARSAMQDARRLGCNHAVCYLDDMQLSSVAMTVN